MKVELSKEEITSLLNALAKEEASIKRSINTIKTPGVKECYEKQEGTVKALTAKLMTLPLV